MNKIIALLKPGGKSRLSRYLDRKAIIRVREVFIQKTNDCVDVQWLGHQCYQYPLDAWLIQEYISDCKPDLIIETGTYMGGSAYYFACLCELLDHGQVVSIDIAPKSTIPHDRISYITGSSTAEETVSKVRKIIEKTGAKKIFVVLDSDHSANHVLRELEIYSQFIAPGLCIHVQDGNMDELPMLKNIFGPGPMNAATRFLRNNPHFVRDEEFEKKYLLTEHPYGWLKRIEKD